MASQNPRLYESLSCWHGVRVESRSSVEECCLAAGGAVGYNNVVSASRMYSAVVMFLSTVDKANHLVQSGLVINDQFVSVLPLSTPAKKVILPNVPLFISDKLIAQELSRFGKLVSPIKKIPLGCKSPLVKHLVSFRRLVFMVLRDGDEELDLVLKLRVERFECMVFVSSDTNMKCFRCGLTAHLVRACPEKLNDNTEEPAASVPASGVSAGAAPAADEPFPTALTTGEPAVDQPGDAITRSRGFLTRGSKITSTGGTGLLTFPVRVRNGCSFKVLLQSRAQKWTEKVYACCAYGDLLSKPSEIRQQTVSFFSKLYKSKWSEAREVEEGFFRDHSQLTRESAAVRDAELSLEELHEALQGMENGWLPGIDGLPVEFYKAFWSVLGQDVLSVLRSSICEGTLPLSCRKAVLTLLLKKGDLSELKNWRPVSVMHGL
ncbi:hypothetical protein MHYP_G00160870 [Metynnis hypsauchen]